MDDSCAVCADNLEWVAYGPCGHREVCSTCVVRLRFICDDRRCCICKAESDVVFITKAMGDYTRMISDFSQFPAGQGKEGKVGSFWYHDDTQAFFDDAEHFNMIKATCRLSCSVCDKEELPQQDGGFRKRQRFRSIGQLKGHLAHQHKLLMCDLCLEGRKVFISEQKLYTKAQLSQHKRTGDSVVDGTESERGGFSGHPLCEFCRTSFYGENELYTHMSREHFTCHICQRRHPEHYEYYKDYDDLESHFLRDHHLCEDEECLRRKFIVFQTAEDLKRHNALEHGGRMSRSQRNAALQIPTSFRYTSNNESGYHRGRRRTFRREPSAEANGEFDDSLERVSSLAGPSSSPASTEPSNVEPLVQPFEQLSTGDSEARYRQAVSQISTTGRLAESSFPPLAGSSSSSQQKSHSKSKNTMAARLRGRGNSGRVSVLNVAQPRTASSALFPAPVTQAPRPAAITPAPRPTAPTPAPRPAAPAPALRPAAPTPAPRPAAPVPVVRPAQGSAGPGPAPATSAPWPSLVPSSASGQIKAPTVSNSGSSSYAGSLRFDDPGLASGGSWVSVKTGGTKRLNHSTSAPNLVENKFDPVADFPPVSAAQSNRPQSSGKNKIEDVQTANKSLVERMRAALDYDEDKYNAFKGISHEYRLGSIDTWEYFSYVKQFDLTHLVPDLARLCPEPDKEKELLEAYNASMQSNRREAFQGDGVFYLKGSSSSIKDKGKKVVDSGTSRPQESLADSVINTVRSLQSQIKPSEEIEVLEKDGYRASRGKSTVAVSGKPLESRGSNQQPPSQSLGGMHGQSSVDSAGPNKQKKKSKFHSRRLGDNSPAAVLDVRTSTPESGAASDLLNPLERPTTRSVWGGAAGQKLFAK